MISNSIFNPGLLYYSSSVIVVISSPLIPVMITNTYPSGAASGNYHAVTYDYWNAFNPPYTLLFDDTVLNTYVEYDFGTNYTVNTFTGMLHGYSMTDYVISLSGSTDNINWNS